MQLQKLVYFAHAWYLATKDAPLLDTPVKAWNFGPVIPPLYNTLKEHGNGYVTQQIARFDPKTGSPLDFSPEGLDKGARAVVNRVWEIYGHLTGGQMSSLTHQSGEPWDVTYKQEPFSIIPDEEIKGYYQKRLKR